MAEHKVVVLDGMGSNPIQPSALLIQGDVMSDKKFGRGGNNPHIRTSEKKPCEVCGERVNHYSDGTIERHKQYLYKKVKGVYVKTSKWSYCENKRWR